MTEQTENATRLARPLIRLAKLVGVATSYVGMITTKSKTMF